MKTALSGITAAVLTGLLSLTSVMPAQAQNRVPTYSDRDRVVQNYCGQYSNDRDCQGYYRGGWGDNDYNRFYHNRRSGLDSIASGIFGFTFGAILGSALANSSGDRVVGRAGDRVIGRANNYSGHVAACYARFRSYDERTDTYLGYDGRRHYCNL
ncbi:BA14K family protein [Devosia sp. 2618]|uniref:BA14K family protein n=1 Tax=Devosia sp. 2618 TaxID=3156454 RepID=UPI0033976713